MAIILVSVTFAAHYIYEEILRSRQSSLYQVRYIHLNQNSAFSEQDVVRIANISLDQSIYAVDLDYAHGLLNRRPELEKAEIKRHPPSTLEFIVAARQPYAWIECEARGFIPKDARKGHFIDANGVLFPSTAMQLPQFLSLPIIVVPHEDARSLSVGKKIEIKAVRRAMSILALAKEASPHSQPWISRISCHRSWGMKVTTFHGTEAIFGIDDHQRQMNDLFLTMFHAQSIGKDIVSINLIPHKNFPVKLRNHIVHHPHQ